MLAEQEQRRKAEYDAAVVAGKSEKELEILKNNWDAARMSVNEA